MNLITITTPETPMHNYNLTRAKCEFYEPLEGDSEGICVPTKRVVSRFGGCNNPENCADRKRYLESIKRIK
jgi:hypothetical protein